MSGSMRSAIKVLTNKYLLSGVIFVVWMAYFDQNDYYTMQQHKKELKAVKDNVAYLSSETARMQKEHDQLMTDPQKLEQLARESYHMKRDNEDVYVIDRK